MKLDVVFGSDAKKKVSWDKPLEDFPKLMLYNGKKCEWVMYRDALYVDKELIFSELPKYDPNFYVSNYAVFEDMFEKDTNGCQCGAAYSSFSWDHMRFCPKHVKW